MNPGDLVALKDRARYGIDAANGHFIDIPGGSIGIFVGIATDPAYNIYDLIFTGGKLVKCAKKVWSVINETR